MRCQKETEARNCSWQIQANTRSTDIQHSLPLKSPCRVCHLNLFPKIKITVFKDLTNWHLICFWNLGGVNTKVDFILVSISYPKRSSFMCNVWQTNLDTALIFKRKYSQFNAESIWRFSFMIYLKNLKRPWTYFHWKQLLLRLQN